MNEVKELLQEAKAAVIDDKVVQDSVQDIIMPSEEDILLLLQKMPQGILSKSHSLPYFHFLLPLLHPHSSLHIDLIFSFPPQCSHVSLPLPLAYYLTSPTHVIS